MYFHAYITKCIIIFKFSWGGILKVRKVYDERNIHKNLCINKEILIFKSYNLLLEGELTCMITFLLECLANMFYKILKLFAFTYFILKFFLNFSFSLIFFRYDYFNSEEAFRCFTFILMNF
jgi:hypothetical protein